MMSRKQLLALLCALPCALTASLRIPRLMDHWNLQNPLVENDRQNTEREYNIPESLDDMLDAMSVMQDTYFDITAGTWPDAIDWTAAVMGTHISATLAGLVNGASGTQTSIPDRTTCSDLLGWENTVSRYFAQTSIFYFAENAFGLRNQAFDDMLWVVLGWLENIKFADLYSAKRRAAEPFDQSSWHGMQFIPLAAHRARVFYELAEDGWDERLCGGGMVWNPDLDPYKNAITNELFAAASIAMYLYYPGDDNTSPFREMDSRKVHDPAHLGNAIKAYKWLRDSNMRSDDGLYQDGYHITGWHRFRNGTVDPGTKECDELDKMVYTYNQGVMLSASRGLWLATGKAGFLADGHELIEDVVEATGWPATDRVWKGLGRGGILEEYCDHGLYCSQDGQTFKGIFFHHLTEFCRPLSPQEEEMLVNLASSTGLDEFVYRQHMAKCERYGQWVERNADAVMMTKNDDGLFGMWWGVPTHRPGDDDVLTEGPQRLPDGVEDHRNPLPISAEKFHAADLNDRGRGRTVETQSGGLAVLRARWQWRSVFG